MIIHKHVICVNGTIIKQNRIEQKQKQTNTYLQNLYLQNNKTMQALSDKLTTTTVYNVYILFLASVGQFYNPTGYAVSLFLLQNQPGTRGGGWM